jgi:protocatechuate 3,4-dioxygenase beta subunit
VQVAAGAEADGIVIRWQRVDTVRVRGKIAGAGSGAPAVVRLSPRGVTDSTLAYWQGGGTSDVDKDGSFEIKGVTPGAYLLSAGFMAGEDFHVATAFVEVGGQHIDGLVLQPVPALELAGAIEVADNAAARLNGVQIGLEPAEYAGITTFFGKPGYQTTVAPPATAREDGRFTLKMVPPNRYRVQVRSLPEGSYVKSIRYGGQMVSEEGIDLTSGVSGSLQVTLSMAGARVEGVVQGTDDKPVSGATVVLAPASQRYSVFKETWTGEDGSYSIKGIAPGEYGILAWDDIEPGAYQDPEVLKRYGGNAERLALKEGDRRNLMLKVIPSHER